MDKNYKESLNFWNQAFEMSDEEKEKFINGIDPDNDWKDLASCEKLKNVLVNQLASQKNVLDYGCGEGWAGIILNKSGCENVTSVDVVENAILLADLMKKAFKIEKGMETKCISVDWLKDVQDDLYDGIFCSNVIDVLPADVAEGILENFARIAACGAKIVIAMNYYVAPVNNPEKKIEFRNGNELYMGGVLRMVTRTDEEWTEIFSKYFDIEKIEYFAWPGEAEEKRRIFIMKKKN